MYKTILACLFLCFLATPGKANDTLYVTPDPCNTFTTIHFSISGTDTVTLEIYDRFGRRAKAIFMNTILPAGTYAIHYATDTLPRNIYVATLTVNSVRQAQIFMKDSMAVTDIHRQDASSTANNHVTVFPNPTSGNLNISFDGPKTIHLSDLSGKKVNQYQTDLNVIDLSGISKGTYLLRVYSDKHELIVNQKIVKTE